MSTSSRQMGSYLKDIGIDLSEIEKITLSGDTGRIFDRIYIHLKDKPGSQPLYKYLEGIINSKYETENPEIISEESFKLEIPSKEGICLFEVDAPKESKELREKALQNVQKIREEFKNDKMKNPKEAKALDQKMQTEIRKIYEQYKIDLFKKNNEFLESQRNKFFKKIEKITSKFNEDYKAHFPEDSSKQLEYEIEKLYSLKNNKELQSLLATYEKQIAFYSKTFYMDQLKSLVAICVPEFIISYQGDGKDLISEETRNKQKLGQKQSVLTNALAISNEVILAKNLMKGEKFDKHVIGPEDNFLTIKQKLSVQEKSGLPYLFEGNSKLYKKDDAIQQISMLLIKVASEKDEKELLEILKALENKRKATNIVSEPVYQKYYELRNINNILKMFESMSSNNDKENKKNIEIFYSGIANREDLDANNFKALFDYVQTGNGKKLGLTKTKILNAFYLSLENNKNITSDDLITIFSFSYSKNGKEFSIDKEKVAVAIQKSLKSRDDLSPSQISDFLKIIKDQKEKKLSIEEGRTLLEKRISSSEGKLTSELVALANTIKTKLPLVTNSPKDLNDDEMLKFYRLLESDLNKFDKLFENYDTLKKNLEQLQGESKSQSKYNSLMQQLLSTENEEIVNGLMFEIQHRNSLIFGDTLGGVIGKNIVRLEKIQQDTIAEQNKKIKNISNNIESIDIKTRDEEISKSRKENDPQTFLKNISDEISKLENNIISLNEVDNQLAPIRIELERLSNYIDVKSSLKTLNSCSSKKTDKIKETNDQLKKLKDERDNINILIKSIQTAINRDMGKFETSMKGLESVITDIIPSTNREVEIFSKEKDLVDKFKTVESEFTKIKKLKKELEIKSKKVDSNIATQLLKSISTQETILTTKYNELKNAYDSKMQEISTFKNDINSQLSKSISLVEDKIRAVNMDFLETSLTDIRNTGTVSLLEKHLNSTISELEQSSNNLNLAKQELDALKLKIENLSGHLELKQLEENLNKNIHALQGKQLLVANKIASLQSEHKNLLELKSKAMQANDDLSSFKSIIDNNTTAFNVNITPEDTIESILVKGQNLKQQKDAFSHKYTEKIKEYDAMHDSLVTQIKTHNYPPNISSSLLSELEASKKEIISAYSNYEQHYNTNNKKLISALKEAKALEAQRKEQEEKKKNAIIQMNQSFEDLTTKTKSAYSGIADKLVNIDTIADITTFRDNLNLSLNKISDKNLQSLYDHYMQPYDPKRDLYDSTPAISALKQERSNLDNALHVLNEKILEIVVPIQMQLEPLFENTNSASSDTANQIQNLKVQIDALQNKINSKLISKDFTDLNFIETEISKLETLRITTSKKIEDMEITRSELQASIDKLSEPEKSSLNTISNNIKSNINALQQSLKSVSDTITSVKDKQPAFKAAHEIYKAEIASADKELNRAESEPKPEPIKQPQTHNLTPTISAVASPQKVASHEQAAKFADISDQFEDIEKKKAIEGASQDNFQPPPAMLNSAPTPQQKFTPPDIPNAKPVVKSELYKGVIQGLTNYIKKIQDNFTSKGDFDYNKSRKNLLYGVLGDSDNRNINYNIALILKNEIDKDPSDVNIRNLFSDDDRFNRICQDAVKNAKVFRKKPYTRNDIKSTDLKENVIKFATNKIKEMDEINQQNFRDNPSNP